MATDARISLAGEVVDTSAAIAGGLANREKAQTMDIRKQILENQSQAQQINNVQAQGQYMNQLATGLMDKPLDQRAAIVAQQLPFLQQMGFNPSEILSQDLTNQGLGSVVTKTQPFMQSSQSSGGFQKGSSIRYVDAQGNTQVGTTVFDPNTGQVSIKSVPLPGQFVSDLGQTVEEKAATEIETATGKATSVGEATTEVLAGREEALRPGQVATAEAIADVELDQSAKQQAENIRQSRASARKVEFSNNLQTAKRSLPRLTEAFKLASEADQGIKGVGKLALSKLLPNIDVSDTAALDSALTTLALDELQKFKGPTTDFEFGVTQNISGQLIGSRSANLARIAALQRNNWFLGREAEQFNDWVDNGGDPDRFAFNFTEIQPTKKGDFTLKQIQDTAVSNSMSIEQVLEALNK